MKVCLTRGNTELALDLCWLLLISLWCFLLLHQHTECHEVSHHLWFKSLECILIFLRKRHMKCYLSRFLFVQLSKCTFVPSTHSLWETFHILATAVPCTGHISASERSDSFCKTTAINMCWGILWNTVQTKLFQNCYSEVLYLKSVFSVEFNVDMHIQTHTISFR